MPQYQSKFSRALAATFGIAAMGIAAANIPVEREYTGIVNQWMKSSCGNTYYGTDCADGRSWLYYADFKPGPAIDISALVKNDEDYEKLYTKAWNLDVDKTKPKNVTVTYDVTLARYLSGSAYYAKKITVAP